MYNLLVAKSGGLRGNIRISSAKNSVLPILAASILSDGAIIDDVPRLQDVLVMGGILATFGAKLSAYGGALKIDTGSITGFEALGAPVRKLRGSILALGPMLSRHKRVRLATPGGCAIGERPIDIHINALRAMGADIEVDGGIISASTSGLEGCAITLDYPSVGATENIMMAACLARGITTIENAAMEPEIADLAGFLRKMGASISGEGSGCVRIVGTSSLSPARYRPIPDRIEAGTMMIAAAISGGDVTIFNVLPSHLKQVTLKLIEAGAAVIPGHGVIRVIGGGKLKPIYVKSGPYPGYPTDLQAQIMALALTADGESFIEETVFENRFRHVPQLRRMGADIKIKDGGALVRGSRLHGADVLATDLRGGAAMLLAGLAAKGRTEVHNTYNIERGYEGLDIKLAGLGAHINRIRPSGYYSSTN